MATPFSSSIVKIKTKLLPRWPAAVNATAPIVSTKANGAVTVSYNSSTLATTGSVTGTAKVLLRDGAIYQEILATGLGGGTSNVVLANPGTSTTDKALITKWGSSVVTLDASGNGTITFATAFPNAFFTAVLTNGDPGYSPTLLFVANNPSSTASTLAFSVRANPGAVSVRVNWIAYGY